MPPIDGQTITRGKPKKKPVYGPPAPKKKPYVRRSGPTPDAADRARPKAQKRHDARIVERNVSEAQRKVVQRRANTQRQLGLDARQRRSTAEPETTRTLIPPSSRTIGPRTTTTNTSTLDALKRLGGKVYHAATEERDTKHQGKQSAFSTALGNALPAFKIASFIPGLPRDLARNTAKDIYQFPAQVVPSLVQTTSAINEARKGNTKPIMDLAREADKTDPVWNTLAAGANLVHGDTDAAAKRIKQAGKAAREHPGLTALEVFGSKGALGRGVTRTGNTTRRIAESRPAEKIAPKTSERVASRAKKISSTERAPARLPGTNLVTHRAHTRDAFQRYADRKRDTQKSKRAAELRDRAKEQDAVDPREALALREQARRIDPEIMRGKQITRAVDEHVDASEQVRRRNRGHVVAETRKVVKGARKGGPITNLLTQRITRADLGELRQYRDRIKAEADNIDPSEKSKIAANVTLVRDLSKAIEDVEKGKVDLPRLERIADAYAERSRAGQQELVDRGLIDEHQAERAALIPAAANQLGARNDPATLKAFALAAASEAEKAKGKSASAKRAKTALSGAQRVQRGNEPSTAIKRDVSMKPAREGLPLSSRGQSVTAWIKAIEEMDPDAVHAEIKRGDKRERKMTAAKAKIEATKATAKKTKKKATRANQRVRENPVTGPNGAPLSTKDIIAALGDQKPPAFLSQAPGQRGAKNFYVANDRPPSVTGQRTHKSTVQGTFDADPEVMVEQAARTQGMIDAFDSFRRMLHQHGRRGEDGELVQKPDYKSANQLALDLSREGQEWVPIRFNPLGADQKQAAAMLDGTSSKSMAELLKDAAVEGDGGPWVVVPKQTASQMSKHMRVGPASDVMKALQQGTGVFRKTVLATSPTWFLGNVGEGTLRSVLNQAGPRSYLTGARAIRDSRKLDAEAAKIAEARTLGTGHYGFAERSQVHHDLRQYEDGMVREAARFGGAVLRTPGPKHVKAGWDIYTHAVMNGMNKIVENQFQKAMLGKAIRNQRSGAGQRQAALRPKALMSKRAIELSSKAAEDTARGVLDENTASALGREIDRMYGKYSKFSPAERAMIANYTPFVAWTLNAAKFVARLPVDHPAFTAMMAALEQQSEEWRNDRGLAMFIPGNLPDWLQGSIPDGHGGHYRAPTRYTPFSLGVDPLGTAGAAFLPQISGVLMASKGLDWKGDQLRDKNGKEITGAALFPEAVKAFARSTVPLLAIGGRVKQKGVGGVFGAKALAQFTAPAKPKASRAKTKAKSGFDFEGGGSSTGFDFGGGSSSSSSGFDFK